MVADMVLLRFRCLSVCAGKCMAITLELSDNKWRPESDLATLWEENKDALVDLPLVAALGGECCKEQPSTEAQTSSG